MELKEKYKVCRKHFNPQDIISIRESGTGLSKYSVSTYIYELREAVKVK
ncbi:THAP-type domain-containing protein [Aphis craccivora]|uniref:THAP-type domain-containing protein n=1 Tax=Aphis craccivora TaxID=307492 RepID=A0A6G0Y931_APHCR|nr:THAP-type domain-containing protein [Aphis craccivora]